MFQSPVTKQGNSNVYWIRDMTSDELRTQMIARGLTNFDVQHMITDAVNNDGSAVHGTFTPVMVMIFANVETLGWDARIRES